MTKDEIIQYAKENGVELAERMTKKDMAENIFTSGVKLPESLAEELKEKAPSVPEEVKKVPILLLADYWDEHELRHSKGTTVNVPVEIARALIAEDKAERADPMPGE